MEDTDSFVDIIPVPTRCPSDLLPLSQTVIKTPQRRLDGPHTTALPEGIQPEPAEEARGMPRYGVEASVHHSDQPARAGYSRITIKELHDTWAVDVLDNVSRYLPDRVGVLGELGEHGKGSQILQRVGAAVIAGLGTMPASGALALAPGGEQSAVHEHALCLDPGLVVPRHPVLPGPVPRKAESIRVVDSPALHPAYVQHGAACGVRGEHDATPLHLERE